MFGYMMPLWLSRSQSSSLYSQTSLFQQRKTAVSLYKASLSSSSGSKRHRRRHPVLLLSKHEEISNEQSMDTSMHLSRRQFHIGLTTRRRRMRLGISLPSSERFSRVAWNNRQIAWGVGGVSLGLYLSFTTFGPSYAETSMGITSGNDSSANSYRKNVYTDYSITGIPGDGRCLFRSVVHGACLRSGKPLPDEKLQRELADDLREKVADEFVKRRVETEWFVEGDFDTYVSQIRKPHVWGGEPELFMASHVLQMPITVYMFDDDAGGLISIAEYGQEYGKENPIQVLYHGFGHYDALQIPGRKVSKSRL